MRRSLLVPAFAKVNLGLEVLRLREDGYHELRTIFQMIALHDEIRLSLGGKGIHLECDDPSLPRDQTNLAVRAAQDLLRFAKEKTGVVIGLRKRIPVGGGLGGGSSNAAAVLLGLDRLLKLGLGRTGLQPLARRLGADVPFFLVGGTALGIGRGDEVYPLRAQLQAHVVLLCPGRGVSTAAVFRRVDSRLTPRENSTTIFRFVSSDLEGGRLLPTNDLEEASLEEAPELRRVFQQARRILVGEGATLASLSGSGSSYFGLFDRASRARRAVSALQAAGLPALRTHTLSFEQYRRKWENSLSGRRRARGRA